MSKSRFLSAIDLGTHTVRVVIAEQIFEENVALRILGVGEAKSFGIKKGFITNPEILSKSLSEAITQAESMANTQIKEVAVSIGGGNIRTKINEGVVGVTRADAEVVAEDISRAISAAGRIDLPLNYDVIHIIPCSYRLDGQEVQNPIGMKGFRLEVSALIVLGFIPQMKQIRSVLSLCGVDITQFVLSSLAAMESVTDSQQKESGIALVDIGGMTTDVAVYGEGEILHCSSVGIGSWHVTNDLAMGLRIPVNLAERIKIEYGTANLASIEESEDIRLSILDPSQEENVSRYHMGEIIDARLEEIFEKVTEKFRSIEKEYSLPNGVILVGGGVEIPEILDMAKNTLNLPVFVGYPHSIGGFVDKVNTPAYATVVGLLFWQMNEDGGGMTNESSGRMMSFIMDKLRKWFHTFLPV
ncbi:MAG: cell division protein FtsA [Candidatus Moraniibacteriota bacterium]|nr:MAG: cell division protein FtsA [Candidatus Moranbacteria bacterium]